MEHIDKIMKIRKGYSIKLYEYFNKHQQTLSAHISIIEEENIVFFEQEETIWNKVVEKKSNLEKFEKDIDHLAESKGVLDKKRLIEVRHIREQLEKKLNTVEKEYNTFLEKMDASQKARKAELITFLLQDTKKEKIIGQLHRAVEKTFPTLKQYCLTWKAEPISRLHNIMTEAKRIEKYSDDILNEIDKLSNLKLDQEYIANIKSIQIPKSCGELSQFLNAFLSNEDYLDILEKTKVSYPYVNEFVEVFKDTSFTAIRTSIRMVSNLQTTEKKLNTIEEKFNKIQAVFQQVLDKLEVKKQELLELCVDAPALSEQTCCKWLDTQYKTLLTLREQITQKRNEFLVNENIL